MNPRTPQNGEKFFVPLSFQDFDGIIEDGKKPANLDKKISALSSVQASREITTENGCHVKLFFRKENDPGIRKVIARQLLAAIMNERNEE